MYKTKDIDEGAIVQLNNGWIVKTLSKWGDDSYFTVQEVWINGETIKQYTSTRMFLKEIHEMDDKAIAVIPLYDIRYVYEDSEDGIIKQPLQLTPDEKELLVKFNKYRELGENEYETY